MTAGRPLLVALASLTACSSGTSVLVRISAPKPLASLSAEASVDAVNKTGQWTMPVLPATLVVQLADVSVDVDLMISAVDVTGDSMVQRASVRSSPHHQVTLDVMLTPTAGGDGGAIGDGSADGAADDLANADLSPTVIALRSAAKASVLNLSPLSISQPSGTSPGDVLVAAVYLGYGTAGSLPTITPSVGWTLVERVDYSTTGSLVLYWRVAGASEPASYAWSSSGGQNTSGVGWIGAYTGVDAANPVNAHAGSASGVTSISCTTPSLTTTGPGTMLVASFAGYLTNGTSTWSLPSGMTLIETLNNGDNRSGLGSAVLQPASGSTGTFTATVSPSQSFCLSHLLALNPN